MNHTKFSASLRRLSVAATLGGVSLLPVAAQACGIEPYMAEVCAFATPYCPDGYLPADGRQMQVSQYQALYSLIGNLYGGTAPTNFNLPDLRSRSIVGVGAGPSLSVVTNGQKTGSEVVVITANNLPPHTHGSAVAGGAAAGAVSLALSNTSVSGQTINGSVTVNALNGDNPPSGAVNVPTASANTVGKIGSLNAFYPQGTAKVAVPSSHNLTVSGGTVSGSAAGNISLPVGGVSVQVNPNATQNLPISTVDPRLGLTYCIAVQGNYPVRPN